MRIVFREISMSRTRRGKCPSCGKRFQRTKRVYQTVNPYNKSAAGAPKTEAEIRRELIAQLDAWSKEILEHDC